MTNILQHKIFENICRPIRLGGKSKSILSTLTINSSIKECHHVPVQNEWFEMNGEKKGS